MFYSFNYKLFVPANDLYRFADSVLESIMDIFPFEAFPKASIVKTGDKYLVDVKVKSIKGDFAVHEVDQSPYSALNAVFCALRDLAIRNNFISRAQASATPLQSLGEQRKHQDTLERIS